MVLTELAVKGGRALGHQQAAVIDRSIQRLVDLLERCCLPAAALQFAEEHAQHLGIQPAGRVIPLR